MAGKRKAVFIDRDGTLSREVGYVNHPDRFELLPRAAQAVKLLNRHGILAVLVTNQAGAARGYFPFELIEKVHEKMVRLLAEQGAALDGIYFCPHLSDAVVEELRIDCECRKPRPGLVKKACKDLDIDPAASYTVGDKISDVELAASIGARGILVKTGYGAGEQEHFSTTWKVKPDYVAEDLLDAVQWILAREEVS